MNSAHVLIVDDDADWRATIAQALQLTKRFTVFEAGDGDAAIELARTQPDLACAVLDFDLKGNGTRRTVETGAPKYNGLHVLEQLSKSHPQTPVIMMSGIRERGHVAMESIRRYAVAFLDKPCDVEVVLQAIDDAVVTVRPLPGNSHAQLAATGFVSSSPSMQPVCSEAIRAAHARWNVILTGETGTGKDILARTIHTLGERRDGPFIAVNVGAITETLIESELFGAVKGAFTGAVNARGFVRAADHGTLFLDEITSMPLHLQASLLRVIEEKHVTPVGATAPIAVDVRFIAATNKPLRAAVKDKLFREDLMYRFTQDIVIPPLRDRTEDIPQLAQLHLASFAAQNSLAAAFIEPAAVALLQEQAWKGNVRQLFRVVERCAMSSPKVVTRRSVSAELAKEYDLEETLRPTPGRGLDDTLDLIRRQFVKEAMDEAGGNVAEAARTLGYANRDGLKYWLDKWEKEP